MIKYIVFWWIIETFVVPCPRPQPIADEFGRVPYSNAVTLQACYETKRSYMEHKFDTLAEAEAFSERGKEQIKKEKGKHTYITDDENMVFIREACTIRGCLEGFEIKEVKE